MPVLQLATIPQGRAHHTADHAAPDQHGSHTQIMLLLDLQSCSYTTQMQSGIQTKVCQDRKMHQNFTPRGIIRKQVFARSWPDTMCSLPLHFEHGLQVMTYI